MEGKISPGNAGICIDAFDNARVLSSNQGKRISKLWIPIYQRPYCWGREQVNDLLRDLCEAWRDDKVDKYYLGTISLVARPEDSGFDVLDGQQRLTTLTILCAYFKNRTPLENKEIFDAFLYHQNESRLTFVTREDIKHSFGALIKTGEFRPSDIQGQQADTVRLTDYLAQALDTIKNFIKENFIPEGAGVHLAIQQYSKWLAKNVILFAVEVPQKSEKSAIPQSLYKYYDLVNSTGKQLEKSDVLKARLLSKFCDGPELLEKLNAIWNKALNIRKEVNKPCHPIEPENIESAEAENDGETNKLAPITLSDILEDIKNETPESNVPYEDNGHYAPPILTGWKLVVLAYDLWINGIRLGRCEQAIESSSTIIRTSDSTTWNRVTVKDIENVVIKEGNEKQNIVMFIYLLHTLRLCLDQFVIIPTDDGHEQPPDMRYENDSDGKRKRLIKPDEDKESSRGKCRLLQDSLLGSTLENYTWLLEAASFMLINFNLKEKEPVFSFSWSKLLEHMESTERDRINAFFPADYRDKNQRLEEMKGYSYGKRYIPYLLNLIDYLLAKEAFSDSQNKHYMRFTQRTSVEHILPQSPRNDEGKSKKQVEDIDGIWNLALLTAGRNSTYYNKESHEKKEIFNSYFKDDKNRIESFRLKEIYEIDHTQNEGYIKKEMQKATERQLEKVVAFAMGVI